MKTILSALVLAFAFVANAAEVPEPGQLDSRVRYIKYRNNEVALIQVRRGVVTRVVLGDDETISLAASGFASDCKKEEFEWCIRADVGSNQIWIKPKDNATYNNLEIRTTKRDYSMEFRVLPDSIKGRDEKSEPYFRVIYRYPLDVSPLKLLASSGESAASAAAAEKAEIEERLAQKAMPKNWAYSMEAVSGSEGITPSLVFDDGRFTYFQFPPNHEIPAIFYISPTGEESRVNFHVEGDLVVVQRTGLQFVLRLSEAVVGVWNDNPSAKAVGTKDGVTVDGLIRVVRSQEAK